VALQQSLFLQPLVLRAIRFVFPLLLVVSVAAAQEMPIPDSVKARQLDSLRADTRKRFMPSIGNLGQPVDTLSPFHSHEFLHTDASYVGDLLWKIPGVFLREFGEPGQPVQLSSIGVDARGISLQLDGRPLNDPVFGILNLYDIPLEYVNEIETFDGAGALFQSSNAAGGTINFVSHQYNSSLPMTKLRFFQGAFDHILSDGIFAQNISRGLNAMFGFQRHVTDGRFSNAAYDSWNFRARLRYNASEQLNMWISEFYTKSTIGLNGGVDPSQSPSLSDEVTAVVRDPTVYQITSRHDLTAGAVGRILADSASLSKATVYYSSIDREYSVGGGQGAPRVSSDFLSSSYWGMKVQQRIDFHSGSLDLSGQLEQRHVDQDRNLAERKEHYAGAGVLATFRPGDWLEGVYSLRYDGLQGDNGLSRGISLKSHPVPWLELWADQSRSYRFPTIQELFWIDTTLFHADDLTKETHTIYQAGLRVRSDVIDVGLTMFTRRIEHPITLEPWTSEDLKGFSFVSGPTIDYTGATADVRLRIWDFELAGNLTFTNTKDGGSAAPVVPRITSTSEFSFRDQFFGGELDLKTAFRLKAVSHHQGLQFVSSLGLFATQDFTEMPAFTSLDFYFVAKIGDAYLTFEWENPLNVQMMVIPYYPLMDRNIKLGVNWVFTD
jgi:outer membrane receptor protein involved in Fe transport